MKVKVGLVVKDVPQEYVVGTPLMKDEYFDKPDKIRVSPRERFFFAEAAWRQSLAVTQPLVYNYLLGAAPVKAVWQCNRVGEWRGSVVYSSGATAIVPNSVMNVAVYTFEEDINWIKT